MPLIWISISFLLGIIFEKLVGLPLSIWVIFVIIFLAIALLDNYFKKLLPVWNSLRKWIPLPVGVILIFFSLGGFRLVINTPVFSENNLAWYNDSTDYTMVGWVSAPPDRRENFIVYEISIIELTDLHDPDWAHASNYVRGVAQVRMPTYTDWQYGDLLQFIAEPKSPSDNQDFSYKDYLAAQNIHTVIYYPQHVEKVGEGKGNFLRYHLISLRQHAWKTIFTIFPQPESGLLAGILLGMDNDLPNNLTHAYRDTGTSHVIAISGFNMAIIAGLFIIVFSQFLNRYWALVCSLLAISVFVVFVDGSAAVIRAAIMSSFTFIGRSIGRRQNGINALLFVAAFMCLFNPEFVADVSFQLSFMATFGLVVFAQPMQEGVKGYLERHFSEKITKTISSPITEGFIFTIAAQIATLPVILFHFNRNSLTSILANPLIIPIQPAVLIGGGAATVAGLIVPSLGKGIAFFVWPFLAYTNLVVQTLSKIHGGIMTIHPAVAICISLILLILFLAFLFRNYFKKLLGSKFLVLFVLALIGGTVSSWWIFLRSPDGNLHLDIQINGEHSSLVMQLPDGKSIVVNPNSDVNELSSFLGNSLSPWRYQLDSVILTQPDSADYIDDLADRIPVKSVMLSPSLYRITDEDRFVSIPENIDVDKLTIFSPVLLGNGVQLTLIAEDSNGTAMQVDYADVHILIPGGVDYALIKQNAPSLIKDITVIVLSPEDLSYIPPRVWVQLNPQTILWNSSTLSPFTNISVTDHYTYSGSYK